MNEKQCPMCKSKDIETIYEHIRFYYLQCQSCGKPFILKKESNS
jgi:translation initiation factor 2 beta subunit (eIF-2beta)/eIF-5